LNGLSEAAEEGRVEFSTFTGMLEFKKDLFFFFRTESDATSQILIFPVIDGKPGKYLEGINSRCLI
jgi:hypothetical protein